MSRHAMIEARARWSAAAVAGGPLLREFLAGRTAGLRFGCPAGDAPLAPLVLPRRHVARLYLAAARVSQLVVRLGLHLAAGDPRRLADAVGLTDHPSRRLIGAGPSRYWSAAMVRPDVLLAGGVPKLIELNYNSTLGGSTDSETLAAAYSDIALGRGLATAARPARYSAARGELALDVATAAGLGRAPTIALIYSELERSRRFSRFFDEELRRLQSRQPHVVVAELGQVDTDGAWLAVDRRRIDVAFRLYNGESALRLGHDPEHLAALERVRRTSFLATSECLLFTSNAMLVKLFEHHEVLAPDDRDLISRCVPWTVHLVDRRVVREGRRHDLDRYASTNRRRLVIKPLNGHSGQGVVIGASTSQADWDRTLSVALRSRTTCLQEHVVPDRTPVPVYHSDSRTVSVHQLPGVLGPFRLGRRVGGIAVRHPVPYASRHAVNWEDGVLHNVVMAA